MKNDRALNSDQLGGKGEARFVELCHDAKLEPNKSSRDRVGWDFVVNWPLLPNALLDARPAPLVCHVQLKTIWAGNDVITLNLGTLEHIVKDSRPAFIVVFEVSDPVLVVCSIRIIHISDNFLAEILKRLRRAQADKKVTSKITFQATVAKWSTELQEVRGDLFRQAIETRVPKGMAAYARDKEKQLADLGYEKGRYSLKTVIQANTQQDAVEGFLGLKPLRVTSAEEFDTRFGIALPVNSWDATDATITIKPNRIDRGVVTVTRESDNKKLVFYGDIFVAPSAVAGPNRVVVEFRNDLFSIRVDVAKSLDKTISLFNLTITNKIENVAETPAVWRDFYTLMAWSVSAAVTVELRPRNKKVPPIVGTTTPVGNPDESARMERYAGAADIVDWVMLRAEASGTKLRPPELFQSVDELDVIKAIEQAPDTITPLSFTTPDAQNLPDEFEYDMLYMNRVPIGQFEIAYAARTKLKTTRIGGILTWVSGPLQLAYVRRIKVGDDAFVKFAERAKRITGIANWFAPSETSLIASPNE